MRANATAISPLITDPGACPFEPVAPHAICDFLRDTRLLPPIQGQTHGDTLIFEFTKNAASIADLHLQCVRPALPIPAGATFIRWCDLTAIAEIREVRLVYFGNQIYKFGREYLYTRYRRTLGPYKGQAFANSIYGDLTPAQRSQLAQAGFTTVLKLMMPFSYDLTQCMPIVCVAQKPQLQIDIEPLNVVVQSDLATSTAISCATRFNLLVDYYQIPEANTAYLVNKAGSDNGIAYINSNKVYIQQGQITIPANSSIVSTQQVTMLTRGCVKEFMFYFIPLQLRTTIYGNDWFVTSNNPSPLPAPNGVVSMGPYAGIQSWNVQANGVEAVRLQCTQNNLNWMRNFYFSQYHSGRPGECIDGWSYSLAPEQENAALGNLAFANLDSPTIYWNFSPVGALPGGTGTNPVTAANQTLIYTILYYTYTYIQVQGGDIVEAFV